ncbi:hypothetical protein BJV78DRAFT_1168716 [Lactifluus subvellereus]|nr:hypothetical protein BJV78DRAFT_1168716 [Lactifluus subvellereus]
MLATTSATSTRWSFTLLNTRIEFRSMFIATLFLFLFLCLAYLSNPSETSFRSYLTEQSFRHHLSRLDDPADSDHTDSEDSVTNHRSSSTQSSSSFGSLESGSSAFHFSNRAAVALRTSRHAFHSFGVFTIAAVIPNHKAHLLSRDSPSVVSSASDSTGSSDPHLSSFKETWFVGAFGRWWRGGVVDPSWQSGPSLHSKCDEEGWSSGILNIKALDRLEDYNGLPFPTTTHSPRTPQRSPPPKLRSRDRSTSRLDRSSTPPPLPKSAVLPLHTPKHNQSLSTPQSPPSNQRPLPPHYPPSPPSAHGATPNGASPNFDSAPAVAELDRQISQTLALNRELHNQLSEHTSTTTTVDAALSDEVNGVREMKRADDAARSELKVRTKTLEDGRRAAEAGKRDAERRLRATQKAKVEAGTRIERLGEEIRALEAQVQRDEVAVLTAGEAAAQEAQDIRSQVKRRKREVRVAEEVVTALNLRVRELEESVERERIALVAAREKAEELRREQQNHKYGFILKPRDVWESIPVTDPSLTNPALESGMDHELLDPFPTPLEKDSNRDREHGCSGTVSTGSSPHLHTLTTPPPPGMGYNAPSQTQFQPVGEPLARLAKGYSIFDEDLASLSNPSHGSKFLPFCDSDVANVKRTLPLIPNGPIQSLDGMPAVATVGDIGMPEDMLSPSFQSVNDTFLDRDWRRRSSIPESVPVAGSDVHRHVFPGAHDDPIDAFEPLGIHPPPRHRITSDPMDVQRVWLSQANSETVTPPIATAPPHEMRIRWWRSADKERRSTIDGSEPRKGLNPDAKVFNFSGRPLFRGPAPAFDSLKASTSNFPISGGASSSSGTNSGSDSANGSAAATTVATSNSTPGFLSGLAMRAFAPSPAEREALQRALGGSTNTSLERLPSLSEVPTSPALTHAPAHVAAPGAPSNPPGLPWFDMGPGVSAGHSWLREFGVSVPRPRKIKFSPWGDGDGDGIEADK